MPPTEPVSIPAAETTVCMAQFPASVPTQFSSLPSGGSSYPSLGFSGISGISSGPCLIGPGLAASLGLSPSVPVPTPYVPAPYVAGPYVAEPMTPTPASLPYSYAEAPQPAGDFPVAGAPAPFLAAPSEPAAATESPLGDAAPVAAADVADVDDADVEYTISPLGRLAQIIPQSFRYRSTTAHGTVISMVLHVAALAIVANMTIDLPARGNILDLKTWILEPEEEQFEPELNLTLAPPSDEVHENVLASLATSMASLQDDNTELLREEDPRVEIDPYKQDFTEVKDISGFLTDQVIQRRGSVGEEVLHVDGAVDRITHEIASRMEKDPVLVIWLMDASISLVDDRQMVADRLNRVYTELSELGSSRRSLLSAVMAYGESVREMVPPTTDGQLVVEAIRNVPTDESGIENVFSTVTYAIKKYRPLITTEQRRTVVVVWTDESGDDYPRLEEAIMSCKKLAIPVFTVGPSAMFGKEKGTHAYKNPEDGETYMLPVSRGPDALHQEGIRLPFWFGGEQHDVLHAGVGPFGLTRLAIETGGAYFINDQEEDRSPFRLEVMKDYMPDYLSIPEYIQRVNGNNLRRAILNAVEVTHREVFQPTPRLIFEPTGRTYIQELADAQKAAALNQRVLDMALAPFGKGMEADYAKETSKRWRAWYDLTYGRLLAMQVRSNEYNWACAEMKKKGAEFVDQKSNRWKFVPAAEIRFNSQAEKQANEAIRVLKRCVDENPGTPWAVMAQRELKDSLGFNVEEHYVAPPPPPPKRPTPPANPNPPPPVVQVPRPRPAEQPKMIPRPVAPKLPKL